MENPSRTEILSVIDELLEGMVGHLKRQRIKGDYDQFLCLFMRECGFEDEAEIYRNTHGPDQMHDLGRLLDHRELDKLLMYILRERDNVLGEYEDSKLELRHYYVLGTILG